MIRFKIRGPTKQEMYAAIIAALGYELWRALVEVGLSFMRQYF